MRQTSAIALGTGLFVLLGFAALFFLVTQITNREINFGDSGYRVTARFDNIGSLKVGAPVAMAGVTMGRVESITVDQQDFKAVVAMRINPQYNRIPDDSDAAIFTAGLLGGQYIGLGAGGSETYLKEGTEIEFTQSAIVLESLISKFLFSLTNKNSDEQKPEEGAQ
jgi:phospholipid/cholesterol/gamma-HCH transport system substrate-binding protein